MRSICNARRSESAAVCSRDFVHAICAHDFLDKIDIALQIAPVTWNLPCRSSIPTLARALTLALAQPKPHKNFIDSFGFDRESENLIAFRVAQRHFARIRWDFSGRGNSLSRISVCDFANQLRRALGSTQNHSRIDATLEAITGVARQIQISCRSPNARRQKISSLEQNILRRFSHASIFAAHYSADSNRALLISDDKVLRRERVRLAIARQNFFSVSPEPHVDRAFQLVHIEPV